MLCHLVCHLVCLLELSCVVCLPALVSAEDVTCVVCLSVLSYDDSDVSVSNVS
jgi:hypothetical protein